MRFVFTIHSPITFLMAYTIVRQENLAAKDVVLIASYYTPPLEIGMVVKCFSEINRSWYKKLINFDVSKAYDKYLDNILGLDEFVAYVDIMHSYQKLLITNARCRTFHFFEEGTDSYMVPKTLGDFTRTAVSEDFRYPKLSQAIKESLRILRGYPTSLHSLPYHSQSYQYHGERNYYCLSNFCYPGVADEFKKIIVPNLTGEEIDKLSGECAIKNAILIVEETYPDAYGISDEEYKKALEVAFDTLNSTNNHFIYLKLRPNKNLAESRLVKLLDQIKVPYKIIPNKALAEGIFLSSENLSVVGFVSSLLFYASIFGHKGYSLMNELENKPSTRFDHINGFWKMVQKI